MKQITKELGVMGTTAAAPTAESGDRRDFSGEGQENAFWNQAVLLGPALLFWGATGLTDDGGVS